jgi:hypothetical protein
MSNEDINEFENYLFSEDRKIYLNKLIKGTEQYYYFSLVEHLREKGAKITKEEQ